MVPKSHLRSLTSSSYSPQVFSHQGVLYVSGDGFLVPFGTASEDTGGMALTVHDFFENCGSLNDPHVTIHREGDFVTYDFKDKDFEFSCRGEEQEVIGGVEILNEDRWSPLPESLHDDLNTIRPILKTMKAERRYQLGIRIGDGEIQATDGNRGHIITRTGYPKEVFRFPEIAVGALTQRDSVSYLKEGDITAVRTGSGAVFTTREPSPVDLRKVIPEIDRSPFSANDKELQEALSPFIKNREGCVKITVCDGKFEFHSTRRPQEKRARSRLVRCDYTGSEIQLFMNPKILNDMISAMFDKTVEIGYGGGMSPIVAHFKEEESPFFPGRSETYVAMGMSP